MQGIERYRITHHELPMGEKRQYPLAQNYPDTGVAVRLIGEAKAERRKNPQERDAILGDCHGCPKTVTFLRIEIETEVISLVSECATAI
jgi:hypothetical protein